MEDEKLIRNIKEVKMGLGAQMSPKWFPHMGHNNIRISSARLPKKKFYLNHLLGGPLSDELFKAITEEAGQEMVAIYYHAPGIAEAIGLAYRKCVIFVTEDGYVYSIHVNHWPKVLIP